ncbi:MAG: Flp pilus assembly complex ATPase component TadA [Anaerolineae bacterium]|nr:Flp pilus assembly complex ATPase component TadA [Anaerolineae bacterium]MCZ2112735.1 Flp pilus assembly complex ATPase component TadA [Anaerolineae bacterium]
MDRKAEEHALSIFRSQLSSLSAFMDDPDVQEIMVNGPDQVWVEKKGQMTSVSGIDISDVNMRAAIKALAGANSKDVRPVLDCRMTGYRIAAALHPVGIRGNALCIRKHARSRRRLDDYIAQGAFEPADAKIDFVEPRPDPEEVRKGGRAVADMIAWMVKAKQNIIVSGATGSGKTTFLNALLAELPDDERVVTIEDTAELQVAVSNYVGLEASEAHDVTIRSLVRLSLRMRPDRIIVGEVRGPEAYDMLDAMNTGHSGGACSMHADNPILALARLESMVRMNQDAATLPLPALRQQIANTFHFVIHCSRHDGVRGPDEIIEILGVKDGEYLTSQIFSRKGEFL